MCGEMKTENSNQKQCIKMVGNIGILYEDPYILVCRKPAGVPVQSANARVKDMVSILKLYLLEESGKPGEPYLGVVHRLDQPVQGVIVFAKTKQAAANLSSQIADRKGSGQVVKRYCAVVRRNADVQRNRNSSRISGTDGLSSERPQDKHFLYCAKGNERCKRKQTALCDPGRNRGSQPGRYRTSDRSASSDPCAAFS